MKGIFSAVIIIFSSLTSYGQEQNDTIGKFKLDGNAASKTTFVLKNSSNNICLFKADFDLDADGSPGAYNEANTGLLHNDNGRNKSTGEWFAVVTSDAQHKVPVKQGPGDPIPGNYISITSLELTDHPATDCRRYIDPDSVAYFVLPGGKNGAKKMKMKLGDIGFIYNITNKKGVWTIFADGGPAAIVGEGSMNLARQLSIPAKLDAKGRIRGGVDAASVVYICIPSSGKIKYENVTNEMVAELGTKAIAKLGFSTDDLKTMAERM